MWVFFFEINALLFAQEANPVSNSVGKVLYEKLIRTQAEYQEALATGDSLEIAEMCYQLGKRYVGLGDYLTAEKYFARALNIREPLGPSADLAKIYARMAEYHAEQKLYEEAIGYFQKAAANYSTVNTLKAKMNAHEILAGIHGIRLKMTAGFPVYTLDSAMYHFRKAEEYASRLNSSTDLGLIYFLEGDIQVYSNLNEGIVYFKKARNVFLKERNAYSLINTSLHLGDAYLRLKDPGRARRWLEEAHFVMDTANFGDYEQRRKFLRLYAHMFEEKGDWKKALRYHRQFNDLTQKMLLESREQTVERINALYEVQKKEIALSAQENEMKLKDEKFEIQKRLNWLSIGFAFLSFLASAVFYQFFQKYKRISRQNAVLVKEQNHRVKNNLQRVTNLLSLQSSRLTDSEARKALDESLLRIEAIGLVHQRLYDGDQLIKVDLSQFIPELIQGILRSYNYHHLQPVYTLSALHLHVDQSVPLGLIINEVVTNACKYAFPHTSSPFLKVDCLQRKNEVYLTITDNGPGFEPKQSRKTFGLKLIQLLADSLKGQWSYGEGNRFSLTFDKGLEERN